MFVVHDTLSKRPQYNHSILLYIFNVHYCVHANCLSSWWQKIEINLYKKVSFLWYFPLYLLLLLLLFYFFTFKHNLFHPFTMIPSRHNDPRVLVSIYYFYCKIEKRRKTEKAPISIIYTYYVRNDKLKVHT